MFDILVIGGGFAGMWAALTAARESISAGADLSVGLVAREPWITMRPRLYEANPATLRAPLRPVLETVGVTFIQGSALRIDAAAQTVLLDRGEHEHETLPYRRLVLATGSTARPLAVEGSQAHAFSIDDHASAMALDAHLARLCSGEETESSNTFVIVGAGFTGIELACEMRDRIAIHSDEQRAQRARIVMLEKTGVVGPDLGPGPRDEILKALDQARVEIRTDADITEITARSVVFAIAGSLAKTTLETATCIVTTGQIACIPAGLEHLPRDPVGRLQTLNDLRVAGTQAIFAAGDTARAQVDEDGNVALMSCQHARPMGKHAGYNAVRDLLGEEPRTYRQPDYVTCLDLGRSGAVFTTGWERSVQMTGAEAGARKRMTNTQRIYPPTGARDAIFEAAQLDDRTGR